MTFFYLDHYQNSVRRAIRELLASRLPLDRSKPVRQFRDTAFLPAKKDMVHFTFVDSKPDRASYDGYDLGPFTMKDVAEPSDGEFFFGCGKNKDAEFESLIARHKHIEFHVRWCALDCVYTVLAFARQ